MANPRAERAVALAPMKTRAAPQCLSAELLAYLFSSGFN